MRKRLVFRVDDIGYTPGYDMGVIKAFEQGVGTSADVMFDSPDTVEMLKWLKERPWLSIGWHRHLWESPVLPAEEVPSMVDAEGRFKWRHKHPELMNEVTYEDAYKEFDAEMQLCYSILGKFPDIAGAHPVKNELERACRDIMDKYHIPYGVWSTAPGMTRFVSEAYDEYKHLNYISANAFPDPKYGYKLEHFDKYNPLKTMMSLKWTEKEEVFFYGWHPGYCDDHILAESSCNLHRCKELEACCSEEMKQWIIDQKIELVNFRDVLYGTNEFQEHLKEISSPLWIGNFKD